MMKKILLLGSGELGKEFVISAQRKGQHIIACDSYAGAPAMQVADEFEVFDMLNGEELERVVKKHRPDIIVPEIEAIRTERLYDFEKEGIQVVPSARAVNFTMNRKAIRDLAAQELGLKTAKYFYATTLEELKEALAGKESVLTMRGLGYMIGIETTGDLPDLVARARAKGLIILTAGTNVIRLLPPLTITNDHIHQAVGILKDVFD